MRWIATCFIVGAVLLVVLACGSSKKSDTVAAIEACVDQQTPAIDNPDFRRLTRLAVGQFCLFAAGETGVLGKDGSVSDADRRRILRSHPKVVSDICSAPIVNRRPPPTNPETLRQSDNRQDAEHKKICAVFLRHLH